MMKEINNRSSTFCFNVWNFFNMTEEMKLFQIKFKKVLIQAVTVPGTFLVNFTVSCSYSFAHSSNSQSLTARSSSLISCSLVSLV